MTDFRIERLRRDQAVDAFDYGDEALNRFLKRHALQGQQAGASQTYLALAGETVVGFHSLVVGQIAYTDAPERLVKGQARHPVPVMILARLAVARDQQGQGLGSGLLKDAMYRTLAAADIAGIRAFVVHAKDDAARRFYERFHFQSSPDDDKHLHVLLKDVRKLLGL